MTSNNSTVRPNFFSPWINGEKAELSVAVHDGKFHADDVYVVAALKYALPNVHIEVTRVGRRDDFTKFDVVADIGLDYDPNRGRFDHHDRKNAEIRMEFDPDFRHSALGLLCKELFVDQPWFQLLMDDIRELELRDNGELDAFVTKYGYDTHKLVRKGEFVGCQNPAAGEDDTPAVCNAAFERCVDIAVVDLAGWVRHYNAALHFQAVINTAKAEARKSNSSTVVFQEYVQLGTELNDSGFKYAIIPGRGVWMARSLVNQALFTQPEVEDMLASCGCVNHYGSMAMLPSREQAIDFVNRLGAMNF